MPFPPIPIPSMKYRAFIVFVAFFIGSCTTSQPAAPATSTVTASPLPTGIQSFTSTPSPLPTATRTLASLPAGREIVFEQSGDKAFTGTLYGEGETAILLANMSIGGEAQWHPFVAAVDKQKFTTVTFNYRDIDDVGPDMRLILSWLKEQGLKRLVCIGASLGTSACNSIALEPETAGIVLIAGAVHHASVAKAVYPKLFISGALDVRAFDIQQGYERATEPRQLVLFEENRAHGTDLFASKDGEQFLRLLIDFVTRVATP